MPGEDGSTEVVACKDLRSGCGHAGDAARPGEADRRGGDFAADFAAGLSEADRRRAADALLAAAEAADDPRPLLAAARALLAEPCGGKR